MKKIFLILVVVLGSLLFSGSAQAAIVDGYNHYCQTVDNITSGSTIKFQYSRNDDRYSRYFMVGINCPDFDGKRFYIASGCQQCGAGKVCNIGMGSDGVYSYTFDQNIGGSSTVCTWPSSDHEPGQTAVYSWSVQDLSSQNYSTYPPTADRNLLLAQIQEIKRQIILLQIQLIQIRIADLQRQLERLNSNNNRAFIDILYPNGGEKLENQHCYNILWESSGIDRVSIGLDAGSNRMIFAENVRASDGRYNWCAGNVEGDDYRIRIFDMTRQSIGDISSASFSIFDNADGKHCSDGTVFGKCSTDKPKLCIDEEVDLADACHSCGCPSGSYCGSDSKCH